MIRFYCDQCGKSLRASENIVGKKVRCTACPTMMKVPPQSTRKPGENRQLRNGMGTDSQDEDTGKVNEKVSGKVSGNSEIIEESAKSAGESGKEQQILSVLADSDSFNSFDDFDFSNLQLDVPPKSTKFSAASVLGGKGKQSTETGSKAELTGIAPPTEATPIVPFALKSASKPKKSSSTLTLPNLASFPPLPNLPSKTITTAAVGVCGLILLIFAGYFVARSVIGRGVDARIAEFENLATVQHHAQVLRELRKAERVMFMMEEGYLSRNLPESELEEVRNLRDQVKEIADSQAVLKEAAALFAVGDEEEAKKVIRAEKNRMTELTAKIEKQNEWLKKRVYSR